MNIFDLLLPFVWYVLGPLVVFFAIVEGHGLWCRLTGKEEPMPYGDTISWWLVIKILAILFLFMVGVPLIQYWIWLALN